MVWRGRRLGKCHFAHVVFNEVISLVHISYKKYSVGCHHKKESKGVQAQLVVNQNNNYTVYSGVS